MKTLILAAIRKNSPIAYSDLEARAVKRGVSLDELDTVLQAVHKDRRVKTKVSGDDIIYTWQEPKVKDITPHLTWLRDNYPRPDPFIMPFPEIDMSWIVLKPDAMVEYKEQLNGGRPKYGQGRKQNPARNH